MFYLPSRSRALVNVKATPCVVHDSDWSSLMYRPVMDQTGSRLWWDRNRNIMNYGPCSPAASWPPPSGFTWNSCSEHNLSGPSFSMPRLLTRARWGQGTRRRLGHLKKSVLTFSGGTLKIFTVWRLNFSPENCPGQVGALCPWTFIGFDPKLQSWSSAELIKTDWRR